MRDRATPLARQARFVSVSGRLSASECVADVDGDAEVDVLDLIEVIVNWARPGGAGDVNQDGLVDVLDLILVIINWGPCE